jgi:alkylhydroperoxidase family enzyme
MTVPRIAPVDPASAPPALREELARWMPPGAAVEPLLLFRTLAAQPALMGAMRPLGSHLLGRRARLPLRAREILIDRVCARCGCEYEWGVHVSGFAAAADLGAQEIDATVHGGADAACWSPAESALVRAVDELCERTALSQAAWDALAAHWDDAARLEIVVAIGWYRLIAGVCNALALAPEPWAARFPARAQATLAGSGRPAA